MTCGRILLPESSTGRGRTLGLQEGTHSAVHETDEAAGEYKLDRPFSSLLSTTRDVLFSPRRFFDGLQPDGTLGAPVVYFLVCSATTAVINTVATLAFLAVPAAIALATGSLDARLLVSALVIFVFVALVVVPVLFVVGFFASVPIQHVFILLVAGRDQKGLSATLRVSCYSVGAPVAVTWVPLAGIPAVFYCFYLHATGLKRVHEISTGRSLGATLMLTTLLLVLATVLAVYDYGLVQEAIK
jgi:hypothetical protein